MQLSLIDYHKIDDLKVYFNKVTDWGYILVLLQSTHQSLAELSPQLHVASLLRSFYERYFLTKLSTTQS